MYMVRNKKININMITMGMAVMVENEDSVWYCPLILINIFITADALYWQLFIWTIIKIPVWLDILESSMRKNQEWSSYLEGQAQAKALRVNSYNKNISFTICQLEICSEINEKMSILSMQSC